MERPRYIVRLSAEERAELETIVKKGKRGAHKIRNAQILLHSDEIHQFGKVAAFRGKLDSLVD